MGRFSTQELGAARQFKPRLLGPLGAVGYLIGLIAKAIVPGRQDIPLWLTVVLGIVGALIGNWLAALFGVRFTGGIDWIRHILQVGAAAVLIAVVAPMWMRRGAGRGL